MDLNNLSSEDRALLNAMYGRIKNADGWIKSAELQEFYSISGAEVRACIHIMRERKLPIISGNNGYKFAHNEAEINQCIGSLYSRVGSIARAARGLVGARDKYYSGQASIEFEMIDNITETVKVLENETNLFGHRRPVEHDSNDAEKEFSRHTST